MQFSTLTWGIISVFGGCLLQFTMGAFYSFGNMMTYMVSYMRYHGYSPSMTYTDFMIVQSTWGMTQGVIMPFSGFIISVIGEKCAMVSGAALFSAGCALTYITIDKELWMVAGTYGFISAFGQNIALIPTLTTGMRGVPNNKGTVMGIVVGGFGGGAMIFNYIQSRIVNPYNVQPIGGDGEEKYFMDEEVLSRVPDLLWILALIYFVLGLTGALMVVQPSKEWTEKQQEHCDSTQRTTFDPVNTSGDDYNELEVLKGINTDQVIQNEPIGSLEQIDTNTETVTVTWKQAFRTKELYLLWITRLSIVLISQVVAGLYKAFGTTFINDDSFLVLVGSISAIFNCFGRVFYGCVMDRFSYRIAMSAESILLTLLVSTFYVSSIIDPGAAHQDCFSRNQSKLSYLNSTNSVSEVYTSISTSDNISLGLQNYTMNLSKTNIAAKNHHINISECEKSPSTYIEEDKPPVLNDSLCQKSETSMLTKVMYAIWVWAIFLTFPGTYAMQPAVTAQTFGHKDSGTIYAFLFSSDIVNNLIVATLSDGLVTRFGYLGLFLFVSAWGIVALVATLFYPKFPKPSKTLNGSIALKKSIFG